MKLLTYKISEGDHKDDVFRVMEYGDNRLIALSMPSMANHVFYSIDEIKLMLGSGLDLLYSISYTDSER